MRKRRVGLRGMLANNAINRFRETLDIMDMGDIINSGGSMEDASKSIKKLTYNGSGVMIASMSNINGLKSLEEVDNNIVISVSSIEEASMIRNIGPATDIMIVVTSGDPYPIAEELLTGYMEKAIDSNRVGSLKIAFRNNSYNIGTDVGGDFVLLKGSYLLIGSEDYLDLANKAKQIASNMEVSVISSTDISHIIDRSNTLPNEISISTSLYKEFLQKSNLGALDQSKYKSRTNPALKDILQEGIDSGILPYRSAVTILPIYLYVNGLLQYIESPGGIPCVRATADDQIIALADHYIQTMGKDNEQENIAKFDKLFSGRDIDESIFDEWLNDMSNFLEATPGHTFLNQLADMEAPNRVTTTSELEEQLSAMQNSFDSIFGQ